MTHEHSTELLRLVTDLINADNLNDEHPLWVVAQRVVGRARGIDVAKEGVYASDVPIETIQFVQKLEGA